MANLPQGIFLVSEEELWDSLLVQILDHLGIFLRLLIIEKINKHIFQSIIIILELLLKILKWDKPQDKWQD
jgi:hypothetical protein